MRTIDIRKSAGFELLACTRRSQAASMALEPGETVGGPDNRHEDSDQWLFVLSGTGKAVVEGVETRLSPGSLLLIEAGDAHQVTCEGMEAMRTLNFYSPPAY